MTQEFDYYNLTQEREVVEGMLIDRINEQSFISKEEFGYIVANVWAVIVGSRFDTTSSNSPFVGFRHPKNGFVGLQYYTDEGMDEWDSVEGPQIRQVSRLTLGRLSFSIFTNENAQTIVQKEDNGKISKRPYDLSEEERENYLNVLLYGIKFCPTTPANPKFKED